MLTRLLRWIHDWLTVTRRDVSVEYVADLERRDARKGIDGVVFKWPIQQRVRKRRAKAIPKQRAAVIYDLATHRRKRQG